jgi:hypothetical protein
MKLDKQSVASIILLRRYELKVTQAAITVAAVAAWFRRVRAIRGLAARAWQPMRGLVTRQLFAHHYVSGLVDCCGHCCCHVTLFSVTRQGRSIVNVFLVGLVVRVRSHEIRVRSHTVSCMIAAKATLHLTLLPEEISIRIRFVPEIIEGEWYMIDLTREREIVGVIVEN